MIRNFLIIIFTTFCCYTAYAQTMHSLIFSDMTEEGREADRTEEMKNLVQFHKEIASALGYKHNLQTFSGQNFTSSAFESQVNNLSVNDGDIVFFNYNGHGCNWDDDDWPHMAFSDKQYWETKAFKLLSEKCKKAKLMICMAACCNMDSRGRSTFGEEQSYGAMDPKKVRALFTQFTGNKSILISSSIRGQYSYSWTSGSKLGSIYGISFREVLEDILGTYSNRPTNWEYALEEVNKKTLSYTSNKQQPQYKIFTYNDLSPRAARVLEKLMAAQNRQPASQPASAKINSAEIDKNIDIQNIKNLVVKVNFDVADFSDDGGMAVAFFYYPKGKGIKDTNGKYATKSGEVCVGKNFGTHNPSATFKDYELIIPMEELHMTTPDQPHYARIGIYDYKTKKYIAFSDYITF